MFNKLAFGRQLGIKPEKKRRNLLQFLAFSAAIESTGQSRAEAQSRPVAKIEGEVAVEQATLRVQAAKVKGDTVLYRLTQACEFKLIYSKLTSSLKTEKFKQHFHAIEPKTIQTIATNGPDSQFKLLQTLGITSILLTDGRSSINLFNTIVDIIGTSTNS